MSFPRDTIKSRAGRRAYVRKFGFTGFCYIYLANYFYMDDADFHPDMKGTVSNRAVRFFEIIGCRGGAKSTIASLAYPVYSALETPKLSPFIICVSDTALQSGINVANIKNEFDNNDLIKYDYGTIKHRSTRDPNPEPDLESDEEWQSKNMLLSTGVRILARSRGQKVRGLRHRQYRPSDIIVDDPESLDWIRTKENRDFTEKWLRGEVLPALDERHGRLGLIGNYLHDDAIMARAKKWGTFMVKEYPLIDPKTYFCNWPAKYPNVDALNDARKLMGETSWQREMLLKVVPEESAPIRPEDITYYEKLPENEGLRGMRGHGVDFAISLKATADFTTCVDGDAYDINGKPKIFILPNPLNARLDFDGTLDYLAARVKTGGSHIFFPEKVGYQEAAIQQMEKRYLSLERITRTKDKLALLRVVAPYIRSGMVMFPYQGCEDLLNQLFNFGVESHDDLVDGLVNLLLGFQKTGLEMPAFHTV